ncbi:N-acetylglucosamine-1-phosphotransferase like protein [Argiope bruennichi]|uniref:N-acetylglucosamine-1-phosphotransferase like protein n=1 Tax=Argiope bruennichi TaxID=94029 RepID=A0A8T0E0S8_ARGBR|nr:N-acetylglucosamine-1-phosphotransferase like protein [Argiope bruennichi]
MRVVTETANYGYFANSVDVENPNKLVPSVSPANFSGPELFHRLLGKCYNLTEERYRYTFCPFQNFTQYEISPRWNAYQGILGIWSHWHIENNTFAAMVFKNGDQCGDIDRSVKVSLKTRYVCHKDALVVYPRLSSELQKEWNHLLTELHYGDITKKGYQVGLEKIFQKAGLADTNPTKRPETTTTATSLKEGDTFIDLQTCNKQYKNLKDEIARLSLELEAMKLMLDLSKMHNRTNKPFRVTSSQ